MAKKDEKVFIQIGEERIELTGVELVAFEADREATNQARLLLEAEYKAKQDLRESAIKKLAQIAGLTEQEIGAII